MLAYVKANNLQPRLIEATPSVPPTSSTAPPAAANKPLPVSSKSPPVQKAATQPAAVRYYSWLLNPGFNSLPLPLGQNALCVLLSCVFADPALYMFLYPEEWNLTATFLVRLLSLS